jgi:hypothetical protein
MSCYQLLCRISIVDSVCSFSSEILLELVVAVLVGLMELNGLLLVEEVLNSFAASVVLGSVFTVIMAAVHLNQRRLVSLHFIMQHQSGFKQLL